MKVEDAFKIQTEIKLLEGGFFDKEVYEYINGEGKEQWEKDFFEIMWIIVDIHHKKSTGKLPSNEANRMWWFKVKLHPELFGKVKAE